MYGSPTIVTGRNGESYRLVMPGERIESLPVLPLDLHDKVRARSFIAELDLSDERIAVILYDVGDATPYAGNSVRQRLIKQLCDGRIRVYALPHLNHDNKIHSYPATAEHKGETYRFVPTSWLLVNRTYEYRLFNGDEAGAERFLSEHNLSTQQLEKIAQIALSTSHRNVTGQNTSTSNIISAMVNGSIAVIKTISIQNTASGSASMKSEAATVKKSTLGPHAGGGYTAPSNSYQAAVPKGFDEVYAKAPAAKAEIDTLADEIAAGAGGKVAKAPLKSRERAIEKINNDYKGNPGKIKDLARNTIIVPDNQIDTVVAQLRAKGASVKVIDGAVDPMGYSGVNATLMTKAGLPAEIQVNSPAMIFAKESEKNARAILGNDVYSDIASKVNMPGGQGHMLYEQWRVLSDSSPLRASLAEESKAYYDSIRTLMYAS